MNEVETTHQKIQAAHKRNVAEIEGRVLREPKTQHIVTSDMEQIKMMLQALMDKLVGLDLYVRSHQGWRQKDEPNACRNSGENRTTIEPALRDVGETSGNHRNLNETRAIEGTIETKDVS